MWDVLCEAIWGAQWKVVFESEKFLEETGSEVLFHPTFLLSKIGHFWDKPISTFFGGDSRSVFRLNYYGYDWEGDQLLTVHAHGLMCLIKRKVQHTGALGLDEI